MTPTHRVTVQHPTTHVVHSSQHFSRAYAEAVLAAYQARGWTGTIEEIRL